MAESNNNFVVKPFAGNATNNGQFGSFDAGTPQTTNDVIFMQDLDAWLSGWLNATSGATKLPRLEEFQGIQRVFSQALININQYGIKPYLEEETYRLNAFVQDENGKLYQSLENNNVGNPLTDSTKWKSNPFDIKDSTPVGTIIATNSTTAKDGYLVLDGSMGLSRATYADLYNSNPDFFGDGDGATTFDLPDLRGKFLGGYTDVYNIGTMQEDAIRNINATFSIRGTDGVANTITASSGAMSVEKRTEGGRMSLPGSNLLSDTVVFNANNEVPTAEENRPKTLRVNWLIKY